MPHAKKRARTKRLAKVHPSTGNVFADLGLPDADELLGKAELAHRICELIRAARLTQAQAATRLGIDQPKVSALMRGKLEGFSTDRLLRFITALDQDVLISIRPATAHARVRVLGQQPRRGQIALPHPHSGRP